MDGVEMVFGVLGKGVGPAHQAADPGTQGPKPTLDMAGFPFRLGAATMRALGKGRSVRLPLIAAGGTAAVILGQGGSQVRRALCAAVPERPGDDLAGSAAKGHPQPERLRLALHEAPKLVEFEHVALLAGQERVRVSGQFLGFFPPASASPSCSKPRKCGGCLAGSSDLGRRQALGP